MRALIGDASDELLDEVDSAGRTFPSRRPPAVRDSYSANTQFFQLMQGYLALGLFVGITGLGVAFPIAWGEIGLTVGAALFASVIATVLPARRAARIKPALAVRVAE